MRASDLLHDHHELNPRVLPPLDTIRRAVTTVLQRWPDAVVLPQDADRERMALDMLRRVNTWDWVGLKTSRITTAAVAVFDDKRCDRSDLAPVRQFYLDEIAERPAGSFLNAMVWIYIESFRPGAEHTAKLANALALRIKDFGARIQDLLIALPGLFGVDTAPEEVAQIMIEAPDPYTALKSIGWRAPHGPGLSQEAHSVFVRKIRTHLRKDSERNRLFKWLCPDRFSPLETGAGPAIEALLSVWREETPPDDIRHELCEAIINAYNDPRLHRGGIWSGFDPELRNVLLRWLTKQDMKFFCDMVTATQDSHMWPPRRDFWLDLYEDGKIEEAWVAFGKTAQRYAKMHLMGAGTSDIGRRFGRQINSDDKSLLIMKIGNNIVVDGCHSYKTHIFRRDDPRAPKLYDPTYDSVRIRQSSKKSQTHHWSERNGLRSWETWVMQNV